jgi:hypothetical protein
MRDSCGRSRKSSGRISRQRSTTSFDFVNVWAAGREALAGEPAAVYDVTLHKGGAEVAAIDHDFDGQYPWLYPPTFLFVACRSRF